METKLRTEPAFGDPNKPLSITVTHEGSEFLKLRTLAEAAIPMLLCPEVHPQVKREQIAQGFRHILEGAFLDSDRESFTTEETDYEPGECLVWPESEDE